ncbi:MAG TPA: hypothetical protein VFG04_18405 [Planctomycetaceae bacterium]|nr:hypothetical protein [Planctomycetaceae bacterium]
MLCRRQGLLHLGAEGLRSQERCETHGFAREHEDLFLCHEDFGESRRSARRLLHRQAGLLHREIGLLFERCKTRLLQSGTEVLCRQQGVLQRQSKVSDV